MSEVLVATGILHPGTHGHGQTVGKFTCKTPTLPITDGHSRSVIGTATAYSKAGALRWRLTLDSPDHPAARRLKETLMHGGRVFTSPTGQPVSRAGTLIGELEVRSIAILPATAQAALGKSTLITSQWETRSEAAYRDEVYVKHYEMQQFKALQARRVKTERVLKQSRQALGSGMQYRDGQILSVTGYAA